MEHHGGSYVITGAGEKVLVERTDHVVSQPEIPADAPAAEVNDPGSNTNDNSGKPGKNKTGGK